MESNIEKLIEIIKEQVQMFLLDSGEFYPFGTCIDSENHIIPVSANLEDDHPSSLELISVLETDFRESVKNNKYLVAVLVIDVTIKEENTSYDAIELRFFEPNAVEKKQYIKYITHRNFIEFVL